MNDGSENTPGLKRDFGRIASRPELHDGRPHLKMKSGTVEVLCVLDLIRQGVPDDEIRARYHDMAQADIDACRAYQARFLSETLTDAFKLDHRKNIFMLDENTSYLILYDVTRLFGKSSHVMAEGLLHADDENDIWAHLIKEKYQAILTSDRDFKLISRRYRQNLIAAHGNLQDSGQHVPAVVYAHKHISREELQTVLEKNQDEIRRYLADNDAAVMSVSKNGAERQFPDRGIGGYRPAGISPRICPSSPPSENPAP